MTVTTLDTENGSATIDTKLFMGYNQEALEVLEKISELNKDFKEIVETVAENTNLKKNIVSKYFKARYAEKTKDAAKDGQLFAELDDILDV